MKFFQLVPPGTNIDFISKFPFFLAGSGLLIALVIYGIFTRGFNYGIDFTGGTVIQVKFSDKKSAEEVRDLVGELGEKEASVVSAGVGDTDYMITVRTASEKGAPSLAKRLIAKVGAGKVTIEREDIVGPKVGAELRVAAMKSLLYSVILIMVYIWFRFDMRFAPGATIAMIHDIILTAGFYLVTGREFSITSVAALLTIAGYSVNDTIVIYDRVREIIKKTGGNNLPLGKTINLAVNLTLSRTLLTALITLLSIIPIITFCDGEIQSFALAMVFGIAVGAYSTIYIAAPFTIYAQRFVESRKASAKA